MTPASPTVLSPSTGYFVLVQTTSDTDEVELSTTESDNEDSGAAAGWSIADTAHVQEDPGTPWIAHDAGDTLKISIRGTEVTNAAPYLPTNVSAVANVPLSIDVTWTAPTTTPSRLAVDISGNGRDWSTQRCTQYVVHCRVWLAASATSYTHTAHLGGGETRHYRIFADHSGTANDGHSDTVSATTSSNPRASAARASGTAGQSTINVSWTPLATLGTQSVTGYGIEVSTDEGDTWATLVANTGGTATTYAHTGLSRGALRHYRVRAIAGTQMSGFGRSAWARTTPNAPGKPVLTLTPLPVNEVTAAVEAWYELSWPRPDDGGEGDVHLTYQYAFIGLSYRSNRYTNDDGNVAFRMLARRNTALSFQVRALNPDGVRNCVGSDGRPTGAACAGAGPWSEKPSLGGGAVKPIDDTNAASLLGRFANVPANHDGSSRFRFELHFSEAPEALDERDVAGGLLEVDGGRVMNARRLAPDSDLGWEVTVQPTRGGDIDIVLPVRACDAEHAVCANDEPLAEEVSATVAMSSFTAELKNVPAGHDGSSTFTFELYLSEAAVSSWRTVAGGIWEVSGGAVTRARRLDPNGADRNKRWEVTVTPSQGGDIVIALPARACTETNAVCFEGEPLAGTVSATVRGRAFTGSFAGVPAEHAGSGTFTMEFHLSEAPGGLSWRTVKGHLFEVSGGTIERARRIGAVRNRGWELTVAPAGNDDVALTLRATASCADAHHVCTSDGRKLAGGATATVPGPAMLSVADTEVDEAEGATLDFVVTLSRARSDETSVDYATSDGTAVAGSDYTASSGTLTFAAERPARPSR